VREHRAQILHIDIFRCDAPLRHGGCGAVRSGVLATPCVVTEASAVGEKVQRYCSANYLLSALAGQHPEFARFNIPVSLQLGS
jgi:hypothetical protein